MSDNIFQDTILQIGKTYGKTVGIIDNNGLVTACSNPDKIGTIFTGVTDELFYASGVVTKDGTTFKSLGNTINGAYIFFIEGDDEEAAKNCLALSFAFSGMKALYDEKYDKISFIRNVMLDNILPSEMYLKSRDHNFPSDATRFVFMVKTYSEPETPLYQAALNMFPDRNKDFVIALDDNTIVVVKEIKDNASHEDIEKIASGVADTFNTEFFVDVIIGIGSKVYTLADISKSYKEAGLAVEVGKIFDSGNRIITFDNLGIGRLIYQLPTTLCEIFLSEVFKRGTLDDIDRETLDTVRIFFDNSLNTSETARKMFIHRNTLKYRLDKVERITGLDVRVFDNAITFKVALMVKEYLNSRNYK